MKGKKDDEIVKISFSMSTPGGTLSAKPYTIVVWLCTLYLFPSSDICLLTEQANIAEMTKRASKIAIRTVVFFLCTGVMIL